jgi:hypothetical protein
VSSATTKAPPRVQAVPAPRKPRAASAPRAPKGKPDPAGQRFGRLGSWGWAAILGVGAVVLSPVVHAFWGDIGVLGLGIFGLGFLLGRWTAG